MLPPPPTSTLTDTLFPYPPLCRSGRRVRHRAAALPGRQGAGVAHPVQLPARSPARLAGAALGGGVDLRGQPSTLQGRPGADPPGRHLRADLAALLRREPGMTDAATDLPDMLAAEERRRWLRFVRAVV